ncbi:MAG: glycosyltransferase [Clostridiales Family XIII bacterium]|jgi:glycosyltransferase involved in cell wall biosynthesis|nr:glycosyltransferase [Clostridiales Family XIII bacterium]
MATIKRQNGDRPESEAPLISVIIPVYNGAKTLARAIDSVFDQTVPDFEILLLNDGSTDGSQDLIDMYAGKYPGTVRAFSHANMGVADTRNKGIALAAGKYAMFLDQDDYFDPDYIERFAGAAEEAGADVVIGGYRRPDKDGRVRFTVRPTDEEYIRYKNLQAWGKIHRTAFLRENEIAFFRNSIGEDIPFTLRENALAGVSVVLDYVGYNWYYNEESVSHTIQTGLERNIDGIGRLLAEIHRTRTDNPLFEYVIVKTVIYLLLACGRVDTVGVFMRYYRELFGWLEAHYPHYRRNKYLLAGPRGQERRISVQVWTFLLFHRFNAVRLFARMFCRGGLGAAG